MPIRNGEPLRVAIVGLGKMGRLHCAAWQRVPDVRLVALVDNDPSQADWAASQGVEFFDDCSALPGRVDLAVVATPSARHVDNALPLLEAGVHCLVEKPLALTHAECRLLEDTAQRAGALLGVGHSERFNPALHLARRLLATPAPWIEIIRAAPMRQSTTPIDCDVVQDLMIHDIDWLLDTLGAPDGELRVLEWRRQHGQLSHVRCQLSFANGQRVSLTACRESPTRQRQVRRHDGVEAAQVVDLDVRHPSHEPDALTRQALAFLAALRGQPSSIALSRQALEAVAVGERIRDYCKQAELAL